VTSERIETTRLPLIVRSADEGARLLAWADRDAAALRDLIRVSGGKVPEGSRLAESLESYVRAASFIASGREPTRDDVTDIKEAMRVHFVVRSVLAAHQHHVAHLEERLREIRNGEDVIIAGESGTQCKARDTMWEIVTAALCSQFGEDVALLDPPDVVFSMDGVRWSIACKMLRSASGRRQMDRVIEGAEQVEHHPDADRGVVLLNVTDALHHAPWSDPMPLPASIEMFEAAMNEAVIGLDRRDLFGRFARRPKARSFMLFGQTMLNTGDTAMLTSIASWPRGVPQIGPDQGEVALIRALNDAAITLMERPS
jgi:hypothetical protein